MEKFQLKQVIDTSRRHMPLIIAHRGAPREAPENTIPAFERAIEHGADGIEFDVLLTKDRVPIVTHDNDLSILTHFDGLAHLTPFSTIKSLDFGSHFRTSFANIKAPTLTEVLELLQPHDISIICELKKQPGMASHSAELVGGIISDFRFRRPVILSSYSSKILYHLKRFYPNVPRAIIIKKYAFPFFPLNLFAKFLEISEIHASISALSDHLMNRAHKNRWLINTWTINEPWEIDRCLFFGVEGIMTDDVVRTRAYIQSKI